MATFLYSWDLHLKANYNEAAAEVIQLLFRLIAEIRVKGHIYCLPSSILLEIILEGTEVAFQYIMRKDIDITLEQGSHTHTQSIAYTGTLSNPSRTKIATLCLFYNLDWQLGNLLAKTSIFVLMRSYSKFYRYKLN